MVNAKGRQGGHSAGILGGACPSGFAPWGVTRAESGRSHGVQLYVDDAGKLSTWGFSRNGPRVGGT